MKQISYIFLFVFLSACTSNTIYKKPKNLIPKDTMEFLLEDMFIASSAKYVNNKNFQKNINYMPFVYEKYKIDSTRFNESNVYYTSKIEEYYEILKKVTENLEKRYKTAAAKRDSLQDNKNRIKDTIKKEKSELIEPVSTKKIDTVFK
ncbi:DUF4296 domain-containing protein [Tenacibaculum sp. UWU-22]|uniref:DUF4296 domain-containing protein n=1 Tax=Tenacibaculum sp. UWU-22 TaxID=3234187 RepID=UPI0034DAFD3E